MRASALLSTLLSMLLRVWTGLYDPAHKRGLLQVATAATSPRRRGGRTDKQQAEMHVDDCR